LSRSAHSLVTPPCSASPSSLLVVAAATRMEMQAAFSGVNQPMPPEGEHLAITAHGWPLLLLVTGIGPLNAGIALAGLLGKLPSPLGVLNLGVAGSFDLEKLPLGQPVLVAEEIWPEYGLVKEGGVEAKGLGLALGKLHGRPVWDRLSLEPRRHALSMGLVLPDVPHATSLTVAGVSGTFSRADVLRRAYGAALENMEGFALAWACARLGVPFLEMRTISNLVGSREPGCWDMQGALRCLGEITPMLMREGQTP